MRFPQEVSGKLSSTSVTGSVRRSGGFPQEKGRGYPSFLGPWKFTVSMAGWGSAPLAVISMGPGNEGLVGVVL